MITKQICLNTELVEHVLSQMILSRFIYM